MMSLVKCINIFLLFNLFSQVKCLKDLKISVPKAVSVGNTVTMSCYYDLETAELYSVRWYFEHEEFYRYVPKESPPGRDFPVTGIKVDLFKSTQNRVVLLNVNKNQSGNYQCEVSADAPYFHTESSSAPMIVIELPNSEPIIKVYGTPGITNKRIVTLDETFRASCVQSVSSYLPVNFTWFVNNIRFPSTHLGLRNVKSTENDTTIPKEVWSELLVHVDNNIISPAHRKRLIVRCETNIYNLYKGKTEVELIVVEENYWAYNGKISVTTSDQRDKRDDPNNSALTGYTGQQQHKQKISGNAAIMSKMCMFKYLLVSLFTFTIFTKLWI